MNKQHSEAIASETFTVPIEDLQVSEEMIALSVVGPVQAEKTSRIHRAIQHIAGLLDYSKDPYRHDGWKHQ